MTKTKQDIVRNTEIIRIDDRGIDVVETFIFLNIDVSIRSLSIEYAFQTVDYDFM
jgi:hypothetical protein